MRLAVAFALLTSPAAAWEFSATPICTLYHPTEKGDVTVTYDPAREEYAIALRFVLPDLTWPQADTFSVDFIGEKSIRIATDRQQVSADGTTITATDTGFDNVLDGLQYNAIAEARSGNASMVISLSGAPEPVATFRSCGAAALS